MQKKCMQFSFTFKDDIGMLKTKAKRKTQHLHRW